MGNIIVRETSAELRGIGRNALSGAWGQVVIACFLYYVMIGTVPSILSLFIPASIYLGESIPGLNLSVSYVSYLYSAVMTGVFQLGLVIFILTFLRTRRTNSAVIFNGFEYFGKAFCISFLSAFFAAMWALLFIIPGIIAYIRYSQALYILADDPSKGVFQCINESKYLMTGNKAKFFCMNLSFIGWTILANLPIMLFPFTVPGWLAIIVDLVLSIPYFFLLAYVEVTNGIFYELVTGHLVAKRVERPAA